MHHATVRFLLGVSAGIFAPTTLAQAEAPAATEASAGADADSGPAAAPAADAPASLDTIPVAGPAEAEAAPERAHSSSRLIEEVIVTAQKREENLQDVPISVQAFSAEALDARGVSDSLNLPTVTPGMVYSVIAGYSIIFIRGVGTDAFVPSADASVSTYIDGIFFPFSHGLVQSFGAVQQVEVLKGPQGTLFGRNSTGGAINVITKKPTDTFEGSVQASYANFDAMQTRAYVNVPVTDTFAFNVSALYNLADSYYKLTADSPRVPLPREREQGARIRAKWSPTDDFDITLSGLLVEQSGIAPVINQNTSPNAQYVLLGVTTTPKYQSSIDNHSYSNSRNPVIYGEANYRYDWFDTKLLASHQSITTSAAIDYDATKAPLVSFDADQLARVNTQELQIISNATTPGADWFKWIGGLYHIDSYAGFDPVLFSVGRDVPVFDDIITTLNDQLGLLGNTNLLDGLGTRVDIQAQGFLRTKSLAGYAQGTVQLPYDFALTLGGRYQTESRELQDSKDQLQVSDGVFVPLFNFANQKADTSNFSPKVTLDFRPADDVLTYASYQKGFKSGTYNILNIYTPTQYIEPETVTAYELGVKSQLFDHRLQFNAAVFDTEIDNMQVQFISLLSGGAVRFESAKHARIRGAEFDLLWQIAPELLPGLIATANGAYLDAKYTDYPNASGFTDQGIPFGGSGFVLGGGVLPGQDFAGNRIVRSPKFSGTGGLSYTFDVGPGTVETGADVYYNSGYFYTAQNLSRAEEPSYATLDARISYLYTPWRLRITAFGKNLTNTLHAINKLPTDIGTWTTYAPPVTYGVRVNWDF
ncbi:MAG: hypothetical protein JWQ90_844 [Hydrocarboniphaga sp.]|uniref:TonB-dependent receptor n=1 Tax=Hydrocarboniphaga sp. TaxID=2033016 RepID=UPI00262444EE|nr:TonB-dependent receptor [Hydrocarboniphaga sp.]MDB5968394.1 hypothetical protein [Hydrocarboniphaga sp.]